MPSGDPFTEHFEVAVAGGALTVARAGAPARDAERVVLAAHGVTASLMTWRTLARELDDGVCLLAPDLRGRGRSAGLPGPYGIATHVRDLVAVLDQARVPSAVLLGHSMGAFVVARLAAEQPGRAAGVVLLDAGIPFPQPDDAHAALDGAVSNAAMRLGIAFPSVDEYVEGWRAHPAFATAWNDDIEAYARYDLVQEGSVARCAAAADAVRADSRDMLLDERTRTALDRVRAPVQLLRAERGLFDDDPLIPDDALHDFAASHPAVRIEEVGGVNHYTLVMGDGPGPQRVAEAVARAWAYGSAR
jgi:pimeloyl-ACP methyl ester carboxylesterase